jgi:diaminopimelate decarboxylase
LIEIKLLNYLDSILINKISKKLSKKTAILIKINPNIDDIHNKISTGKLGDKFGILLDDLYKILDFIKYS